MPLLSRIGPDYVETSANLTSRNHYREERAIKVSFMPAKMSNALQ